MSSSVEAAREALERLRSDIEHDTETDYRDYEILAEALDRKDELEGQGFVELVNKMAAERDQTIDTLEQDLATAKGDRERLFKEVKARGCVPEAYKHCLKCDRWKADTFYPDPDLCDTYWQSWLDKWNTCNQ